MDFETANRLFDYNMETGLFTNKINRTKSRAGDVAGNKEKAGYLVVEVNGKKYKQHRLAFLLVEGYMPEHEVDHINGIRDDNRWCNLRHVSRSCNLQNQKVYSNNRLGVPGVGMNQGKIRARGRMRGYLVDLGFHPSILEAALARYTWENNCPSWTCNKRSKLTQAIKEMWPEFMC